jgi:hypothetical protein
MTRNPIETGATGAAPPLAERVRIADEGERAALEGVWSRLELPPPAAPPPGFARRVAARAASAGAAAPAWGAPRWAGALVFAAGIALGALLSSGLGVGDVEVESAAEAEESVADASLAASYLDAADLETAADQEAAP